SSKGGVVAIFTKEHLQCSVVSTNYFKEQFSLCGSNPKKFWKTVKDLENKPSSSQLPMSLNVDDVVVTDKEHMAELFNHHFINHASLPIQNFLISHPF
ncbi:unnamed protein product, partial [Coregonus sp. 'balchen']